MRVLTVVQLLMQRLCTKRHSKTMTSIHNDVWLQDTLGRGRYGVVRLGQIIVGSPLSLLPSENGRDVRGQADQQEKSGPRGSPARAHRSPKPHRIESSLSSPSQDRVHSPHVVRFLDIYEDSYLVYVVMEYMGGGDLRERLNRTGSFSEREAARVVRQIGQGLLACHQQRIYHLDVKPENIIFESRDQRAEMKLTDFGCGVLADFLNKDTKWVAEIAFSLAKSWGLRATWRRK